MRIARLDGIRAVAVLLVFLRHSAGLPFGWVGVDIFFVLSGFLITGILRRDHDNLNYWRLFYVKRACRILPPLVLSLLAAAILLPIPWHTVGWYYAFFLANVVNVMPGVDPQALSVLWSLAVEEHFYLMWPFAVRFLNRRQLTCLSVAVLLLEPVLRGLCLPFMSSWKTQFYLTPFRLDGLAVGSLLALIVEDPAWKTRLQKHSGWLFFALAASLVASQTVPSFRLQANGYYFACVGYSQIALVSFFFIAYVLLNDTSLVSKVLSHRWPVFLGLISYGFYLFHYIIIFWVRNMAHREHLVHANRYFAPVYLILSIAVSWLSYHFIETRIVELGHRWSNRWNDAIIAPRMEQIRPRPRKIVV